MDKPAPASLEKKKPRAKFKPACSVTGCSKPVKSRHRCSNHGERARRYGWLGLDPAGDEARMEERRREALPGQAKAPREGSEAKASQSASAIWPPCKVVGCTQPVKCHGRCLLHVARARRYGWLDLDPAGDDERIKEERRKRREAVQACIEETRRPVNRETVEPAEAKKPEVRRGKDTAYTMKVEVDWGLPINVDDFRAMLTDFDGAWSVLPAPDPPNPTDRQRLAASYALRAMVQAQGPGGPPNLSPEWGELLRHLERIADGYREWPL